LDAQSNYGIIHTLKIHIAMNQNDSYKGNENQDNFVQKDVFRELELAENAVSDIYEFKEQFRVKTIYENFKGLYSFGNIFKYILSIITGSLAAIGFFFLLYIEGFTGFFNYFLMGLAVLFAASMSFGLEKARYTIVPIVVKSFLRDKKVQKGLFLAALLLQIVSISSTIYGTYNVVNLYYVPSLQDVEAVGGEQNQDIADYQTKIEKAENEKAAIEKRRAKYEKSSGKNGSWIQHKDYTLLTSNISDFEAQMVALREQIRADKKETKADNKDTEKVHAQSKYTFVWVSSIVSLLAEILLSVILFFLIKYKFSTLKQLDTIQSPIQTVLNLVDNPLTQLKSSLIGGNQLVIATNQGANIGINQNTPGFKVVGQNQAENVTNFSTNQGANSLYTGSQIGFKTGANNGTNSTLKTPHNLLKPQTVTADELGKIQLKIFHYEKMVRESESKAKTLKQTAAIERNKTALKNRKNKLRYWQKKKTEYQGKTIA